MKPTNNNNVSTIHPYVYHGQWVFDDESRSLDKEAFVSGADGIMDMLYLTAHGAEAALYLMKRSSVCDFQTHHSRDTSINSIGSRITTWSPMMTSGITIARRPLVSVAGCALPYLDSSLMHRVTSTSSPYPT